MTANELAEIADGLSCEIPIREWIDNEPKNVMNDIATMLRKQQAEIEALKHNMVCILESLTATAWLGTYNDRHGSLHWSFDECLGPTKDFTGTPLYTFEQVMEVINQGIKEANE